MMQKSRLLVLAVGALAATLLSFGAADQGSATAGGGPALQLPWPSGAQHNINYGYTYATPAGPCGTHDRLTASSPSGDNADYYAVDFALTYETVSAAASGTVRTASDLGDDYGTKVVIDHPGVGGYFSVYAHLNYTPLHPGDFVAQGQVIGTSGNTGLSDAPHLHFQLQSSLNAAVPEPMSGVSGFGPYCGAFSPSWMSKPPWLPEWEWINWGTLWGGGVVEEAKASATDFSQFKHSVLARVNGSNNWTLQWRQSLGGASWGAWTTISGLSGISGAIGISNHPNGSQEEIDVVAVKDGDLWHRRRLGTTWGSWTGLGRPTSSGINGPVAVSNSNGRIIVVAVAQGVVYERFYAGSWGVWVSLGSVGTFGGSVAVSTRPNNLYHIVVLRPSDSTAWIICSSNHTATWSGWMLLGGPLNDSVAVDNDNASGACGSGSHPGVHVLGYWNRHVYVGCWDPWCTGNGSWEDTGGPATGPASVSNGVNPYSSPPNTRWVNVIVQWPYNEYCRYRMY